jgi:membrane protein
MGSHRAAETGRTKQVVALKRSSHWRSFTSGKLWRGLKRRAIEDELLTRAAALSFYFIFALFPMLLSLLALLGLFAQRLAPHAALVRQFGRLMPPSALSLVATTLGELTVYSNGWKLVFGLALALWAGSGGISCIMDALNRSRRTRESRPWWYRQIIASGLTAVISGLSLVALVIVLGGGTLVEFIGDHVGLSRATMSIWQIAEWPIAFLFMLLSLDLIFHWGPAVRPRWRWLTPGSVVGLVAGITASLLFRIYLHYFSTYSRSYGSLGAVMVLLLWLYFSGLAILVGGEINAEVDDPSS